jgi:predicted DNA-binding protein
LEQRAARRRGRWAAAFAPVKGKSCSVRMSPPDYERLGILAIKAGITRQRFLKDALVQFLGANAQDFSCACLSACERKCGGAG